MGQDNLLRIRLLLKGVVQGVGLRPWIYRQARQHGLSGYVINCGVEVLVEVQGHHSIIDRFIHEIVSDDAPTRITIINTFWCDIQSDEDFQIRDSELSGQCIWPVIPDRVTCNKCVRELFDSTNRRYLYPFISCVDCGPRYSIMESHPFDRINTSMSTFPLCSTCLNEYGDPENRRFHSQANSCPLCGPKLRLLDPTGLPFYGDYSPIMQAADTLRAGSVIATKGIGGFQLMASALFSESVAKIRAIKNRPAKPLAIMLPSVDLCESFCYVSNREKQALNSDVGPIVLLRKKELTSTPLPFDMIAPNLNYIGVMMPTSGLHHLLARSAGCPLICTSANRDGDPMCIDVQDAVSRFSPLIDYYLDHDRRIVNLIDDSVVEYSYDPQIIRRSRGYSSFIDLKYSNRAIIAAGADLKANIAHSTSDGISTTLYYGNLDSPLSYERYISQFRATVEASRSQSPLIVHDLHPFYKSSIAAKTIASEYDLSILAVQHHDAHFSAVIIEHGLNNPAIGIIWDGTGWGNDKTIWGGETLFYNNCSIKRVGHLRPFLLIGGDAAVRQPARIATSLINQTGDKPTSSILSAFSDDQRSLMDLMIYKNINSPICTSMGRLIDGLASLVLGINNVKYEAQAAIELASHADLNYELSSTCVTPIIDGVIDWRPLVTKTCKLIESRRSIKYVSTWIHEQLAQIVLAIADYYKIPDVVLAGGCFQNRILLSMASNLLKKSRYRVFMPFILPCNDEAIAIGQIASAQLFKTQ